MLIKTVGERAPDFELQTDTGETVRLVDFRGKKVVLFFYPRADTEGCTTEACGFRDDYSGYQELDAVILGISPDSVKDQVKFTKKHGFPFPLLADEGHTVAEAYGVWGLKKFMGREFLGVHRTTFIIDPQGKIVQTFERVKPTGHSREVLAAVSDM